MLSSDCAPLARSRYTNKALEEGKEFPKRFPFSAVVPEVYKVLNPSAAP